ncbi:hypothetical protein [Aquimarina sp. 2201CG5-10]|uniref:toxin-antitoxin system YwqK family antitoxin n=1 Tax=Aquimarina callyspongiae TaxID=3098150 RepID=UPI002AB5A7E3|nr:hypothetical protein [Aquimarina sp. 2201CG5-10]MDY8138463.1 hypothetical protein [Aquimarina sp. 2201CG5-10]
MKLFLTIFLLLGSISNIGNDVSKKIISDDEYNYTFYVSTKVKSDPQNHKKYYWFRSGEIHSSYGGVDGQVLHGLYKKTYRVNGLAEQGDFFYGVKDNAWKSWYENGKLSEVKNWQKGIMNGAYQKFSKSGELLVTGKYKNHKKHGVWIDHAIKDTLYFKKGEKVIKEDKPEEKDTENTDKKTIGTKIKSFFSNTFKKKSPEEKKKAEKEKEARKKQRELKKKRAELAKKKKETAAKNSPKQ